MAGLGCPYNGPPGTLSRQLSLKGWSRAGLGLEMCTGESLVTKQ